MKKNIFSTILIVGSIFIANAQNTIPTTTVSGALSVTDSLHVTKSISTSGMMTVKGEVLAKDTVTAMENILAQKDIKVDGSIYVGDKLNVIGNINTNSGFYIKNRPVITLLPPVGNPITDPIIPPTIGTSPIQVYYGPSGTADVLGITSICSDGEYNPWVPVTNNFGGQIQLYDNTGPGMSYNPGGSILKMISWNSSSSIDVSGGTGNDGKGALLMNYFCGKDIAMCTGANGGVVSIGNKAYMNQSLKIGAGSLNFDQNTSIEINQNGNNTNGVKVNTWNTGIKAYSILNSANKNTFVVYGNGKTQIGIGTPKVGGIAANAMLSVDGLILAKEIRVAIANTHWADYVFKNNYKLMPLKEVEKYIQKNKHLPEVPSATEVDTNGIDVVETNIILLKKIEELTLYLIEQNKRLEKLENENVNLQSKK